MVQRVTDRRSNTDAPKVVGSLLSFAARIPWENAVAIGAGSAVGGIITARAVSGSVGAQPHRHQDGTVLDKPGCTAADESGRALFYLEGLARGNGGFGVLRQGRENLETAAAAADSLGQNDLARGFRRIAGQIPEVHTAESAEGLARELRPLVDRAWRLGRVCGLARKNG